MTAQVLIVEDEASLAGNLVKALARQGVQADVAGSIWAAGEKARSNRYRLVCADIQLGDGNGLSFCENLRKHDPDLQVIMMTGQDTAGNRIQAEGFGAMAFVAKPFSLSRFRELVATLLQEHGAKQTARTHNRAPRVLMYSHDTIGLGHMRRNSAIAARIVENDPTASVLMLVGSPSGMIFDLPPGVDYIKLPSLSKVARDVWRPQSLRISSDDTRSMRASIIEQAADSFDPDVILVDHEPGGVWNELLPALSLVKSKRPHARIILGLRDILDDPARTKESWRVRGTRAAIASHYNDILVYGQENIFATVEQYELDGLVSGKVDYCGYVTAVDVRKNSRPMQDEPARNRPRIVVAGGGGRDAYSLLDAALDALALIPQTERPDADIVAGPLMDEELRQPLVAKGRSLGVRFHMSHPDVPALLAQADLFVTMAGYNSVVEGIATGCPMLIVPRVGPSAEQRLRTQRLQAFKIADALQPGDLSPVEIAMHFRSLRAGASRATANLALDGAGKAAAFICAAIADMQRQTAQPERQVRNA